MSGFAASSKKGVFSLRVFDRYFQTITWVLIALMVISLFILDNAYTTPLLVVYLLLLALRNRRSITDVLRNSTRGQKVSMLLAFIAAVAFSFVLIWYGGRVMQAQGIGPVFLYIWIAVVIAVAIAGLRAVAIRLGIRFGKSE